MRHRLELGGGWTIWRDVELRSAGFASTWIDGVCNEELAHRVDAAGATVVSSEIAEALVVAQRAASKRLREMALDPRFREAVTWQNRRAIHGSIESLLRQPEGHTSSKVRKDEQLIASYAQRYCCKNERAGFYGASTPARLVEEGPALTVRTGQGLIARRSTYLEPWAIDALADQLATDPELRVTLRPRRMPTVRLDGLTLVHSGDRRTALPPVFARLLEACDGETPASRIAEVLVGEPALELGSVDEVYELLDELVAEKVVIWTLEVPTTGGAPEHLLRAELARLDPTPARDRANDDLDELERARERVAAAAGEAERVDAAIVELEHTFVRLTGQDGVRNHGEAYAGRTLVGEDCVRDVNVEIGQAIVERLSGPLQLVLQSARWYTHEIARRYREAITIIYRELRGDGLPAVDYARFHAHLPALFPGPDAPTSIVGEVVTELHARWRQVLGVAAGERRVERSAAALRPEVMRVFAAPGPGWPAARHHSPDVLIAAAGADAVNRGEFLAVLGEIHVGMNSLLVPHVPNAQVDPDAPFTLRDLDVPQPGVAPVWSRRRSRLDYYSRSPRDFDLEHTAARSWRPREQVLSLAELLLEEIDGALVVRTRDSRASFDVIQFLEHYLLANSFSEFALLGGGYAPRITVDGVVLVRERWVVDPAELAFARAKDAAQRFVAARAWARSAGLPRRLFLKVPEETKPVFLDLASPTFVELASKVVRKASRVSISEMLPDLDELWLVDAEGGRYTSEFRIVAVDPVPWVPA